MYIPCTCCRVCHDNKNGRSTCELTEDWNEESYEKANAEYDRRIAEQILIKNAFCKPTRYGMKWRCNLCKMMNRV